MTDETCRHKVEAYRRVYPKGYVEMLERQQKQLVAGIQVLYRKMTSGEAWVGDKALEHHNQPTVHDILAALNLLQPRKESDLHVQDFETCSSFLDDESPIDKIFSVASETRVRSLDHIHPTQLDDRSPPSEIELTLSMDFNGQQSRPEMDTTSVQSFMAMQSIVIQRQPESLSLDWISIPFGDGMIDQPAQMLDDQVHDLEISTLLGTVPAMSQPFISDIGPTSLTMASTYSRRGY
jgi:hypothetical protein